MQSRRKSDWTDRMDGKGAALPVFRIRKRKMAQKSLSEPFVLKKLVRLAGIEPTTPWFVAKYSIQLSYSRPRHAL